MYRRGGLSSRIAGCIIAECIIAVCINWEVDFDKYFECGAVEAKRRTDVRFFKILKVTP